MFAARFLCFGSFPAFSLQVGTNERMKVAFEDGTAETTTRCGPARRHFHIKFDQKKAIFNRKNNDMLYANPDLGMEIQRETLATQKADIRFHSHAIVWRRSKTKGSERLKQKNVSGKMKRNGARDNR